MTDGRRPNILWVCTDQQRFDTIGALGCSHARTPVVDGLVAAGVAFTHAFCQSPICTPSRASFLTGMYPGTVHVNGNGNEGFPPSAPPLVTRLFADAGYECGLVGKLHLASAYRRIEPRTDDGYTFWRYSHAPRHDWPRGHDYADWVRAQGHDLGVLTASPDGVPAALHQTTWGAGQAVDFVTRPRPADRPWLLSLNPYDPHPPFNPPRAYRDRFDPAAMPPPLFRDSDLVQQERLQAVGIDFQSRARRPDDLDIASPVVPRRPRPGGGEEEVPPPAATIAERRDAATLRAAYAAMIALLDDALGRILRALRDSGQAERTLVVFTSDHGEMLGDHGLIQKGCRFYEGLVRVPLVIAGPGVRAGRRSHALVELVDLAPTLLDLAGLSVPAHMQGRSLAPILRGQADPDRHRAAVRCEYYDALDEPDGTFATMWRDRRHKLVVYHGKQVGELYDLEEDPGEFVDLWEARSAQGLKTDLLQAAFDATVLAMDRGSGRIGPM